MSDYVITKNSTKEERLAVIKAAHQKYLKSKNLRARLAEGAKKVRKWTDEVEAPKRKAKKDSFDKKIDGYDNNHNQWTDGSKYLAEHYGDKVADQKAYDADWN